MQEILALYRYIYIYIFSRLGILFVGWRGLFAIGGMDLWYPQWVGRTVVS